MLSLILTPLELFFTIFSMRHLNLKISGLKIKYHYKKFEALKLLVLQGFLTLPLCILNQNGSRRYFTANDRLYG